MLPKNKKAIITLTYDDALPVHYLKIAPLLEKYHLRATFYLSVHHLLKDEGSIPAWRKVTKRGHELGNHSLVHPCRMKPDLRRWLDDWRDLRFYTPQRFQEELRAANLILSLIDGKEIRSYGNTCCDTTIGVGLKEKKISPILKKLFIGARGSLTNQSSRVNSQINFYDVGCTRGDGKTLSMLQKEVERARARSEWLVYMFHGVGKGTHSLFIDETEHREFIIWLAKQKDIYVAPFSEVATKLKS